MDLIFQEGFRLWVEKYGRHDWTRTSDLYRVKGAVNVLTTTYMVADARPSVATSGKNAHIRHAEKSFALNVRDYLTTPSECDNKQRRGDGVSFENSGQNSKKISIRGSTGL